MWCHTKRKFMGTIATWRIPSGLSSQAVQTLASSLRASDTKHLPLLVPSLHIRSCPFGSQTQKVVPSLKVLHTDQVSSTTLARLSRDAATIRLHLGHNWIELTILGVFGLLTLVATFLSFFYFFPSCSYCFSRSSLFPGTFLVRPFRNRNQSLPTLPFKFGVHSILFKFYWFVHGHSVTSTLGSCQCGIPPRGFLLLICGLSELNQQAFL